MSVRFSETVEIKISRFVNASELAIYDGVRTYPSSRAYWLNLLKKNPRYKTSWLRFLGQFNEVINSSHIHIGCLYFVHPNNWLILAYGRENTETLMKIADELASEFGVNIKIELVSEESEWMHIPE